MKACLKEEELEKYIILILECLVDCLHQLVHYQDKAEIDDKDAILCLVIRIYDHSNVCDEYE